MKEYKLIEYDFLGTKGKVVINTNITVTIGIIGTLNFLLCKVLLFN